MFPACDEFIGRIQMNQANDSKKRKKWKHLSERERYNIELLLKEGYSVKAIAAHLDRDRRSIEREIKRGTVSKKIENPYVSRNPAVPDYLIKTYYSPQKAQFLIPVKSERLAIMHIRTARENEAAMKMQISSSAVTYRKEQTSESIVMRK